MLEELAEWARENVHLVYRYLAAAAVIAASYYVGRQLSKPIYRARVEVRPEVLHNVARLVRLAAILIGIAVALSIVGIDLGGLLLAAGFTGLVIGLAAQQTLSNLFAGLTLIFEGRVRVGDSVRIGGDGGVVESVGVMSTKIRLWSGEVLTVPNSVVVSSPVYNFSRSVARRAEVSIGISYTSDVGKAVEVIRSVLWENELVLAEPEPTVIVDSLGESSVNLKVLFWLPAQEFWTVRRGVVADLKRALESSGIEIPYPQRVVWIRSGTTSGSGSP